MIFLIILHVAVVFCYMAAAVRGQWRFAGFLLHAATLVAYLFIVQRWDAGLSASGVFWLTALLGWRKTYPPLSRSALALLVAAASLLPLLVSDGRALPPIYTLLHIAPAALAYAYGMVSMLQSLDLWLSENHRRALQPDSLPPLLTLEEECFANLRRAFMLLSLALLSGATMLLFAGSAAANKLLFSALSWLIFGGLLVGRRMYGWRGAAARWWLLAGFLCFVLGYFGAYIVF